MAANRSRLSAEEAARRLGVRRATLYAYVSRGLIRSESQEGTRERLYHAEDVDLLVRRRSGRRDPARMARAKQFVYDGLAAGDLKPIVARTFSLDEIVEAHRYMESNQQIGKIVVLT